MDVEPDPQRSCIGKRRYGTHEIATSVAAQVLSERGTHLRVYACLHCGGHHLTHKNVQLPKPGYRPPKLSQRAQAELRAREQRRSRRR